MKKIWLMGESFWVNDDLHERTKELREAEAYALMQREAVESEQSKAEAKAKRAPREKKEKNGAK